MKEKVLLYLCFICVNQWPNCFGVLTMPAKEPSRKAAEIVDELSDGKRKQPRMNTDRHG